MATVAGEDGQLLLTNREKKGIFVHFWINARTKSQPVLKNHLVRWLINLWGRDMSGIHMKLWEVNQEFGAI